MTKMSLFKEWISAVVVMGGMWVVFLALLFGLRAVVDLLKAVL